jgi:hypothetical protein
MPHHVSLLQLLGQTVKQIQTELAVSCAKGRGAGAQDSEALMASISVLLDKTKAQCMKAVEQVDAGVKSIEAGLSQEVQRLRSRFNDSIRDTVARVDRCESKAAELQLQTSDVSQFCERTAARMQDNLQLLSSQINSADARLSHDLRVATGIFEAGHEEVSRSLRALENNVGGALADVSADHNKVHERIDEVVRSIEEGQQAEHTKAVAAAARVAEEVAALESSMRALKESLAAKTHDSNRLIAANDLRAREALDQVAGQFTVAIESAQSSLALNTQVPSSL